MVEELVSIAKASSSGVVAAGHHGEDLIVHLKAALGRVVGCVDHSHLHTDRRAMRPRGEMSRAARDCLRAPAESPLSTRQIVLAVPISSAMKTLRLRITQSIAAR